MTVQPFSLSVPDEDVHDLRERLACTRWPDEAPGSPPWAHGTDLGYLRGLVEHWRDGFDWRAQAELGASARRAVTGARTSPPASACTTPST